MKLTGELKNKVEEAQIKEEMRTIIAEAGMELTDEELDGIAGGFARGITDDIIQHSLSDEDMKRLYLKLTRRLNCTPDSGQVKDE